MSPANADVQINTVKATESNSFMGRTSVESSKQSSMATLVASAWNCIDAMDFLQVQSLLAEAGYWPPVECDDPEILLLQGMVLSYLPNSLEKSKDCLAKSVRLFGDKPRAARGQIALAWAYYAGGETQEAKTLLDTVKTKEYRYHLLVALALIEGDPETALTLYEKAEPLVSDEPLAVQAKFHISRAMALRALSDNKDRNTRKKDSKAIAKLRDRSEMEYMAALCLAQDADAQEIVMVATNNLAGLYSAGGKHSEAMTLLDKVMVRLSDSKHTPYLGKMTDTRAAVYMAQGRLEDAVKVARRAVALLERVDRPSWLAESLITLGKALARCRDAEARSQLERAASICERVGSRSEANTAYVTMIRELPLECEDAFLVFARVDRSQKVQAIQALLYRAEAEAIRLSLEKGSRARAAKELGISRQAFEKKIQNNFPQFLTKPKRTRRKSVLFSARNKS